MLQCIKKIYKTTPTPIAAMDKELADFAVAYAEKCGAGYAEARLQKTSSHSFMLKNGVPELSGFESISGLGIRLLVNNALGFVSTNQPKKARLKTLIKHAVRATEHTPALKENIELAPEKPHKKTYEVKQKLSLDDLGPQDKIQQLIDAEKAILATKHNVPGRYLTLSDAITTEYLVNSEGSRLLATVPRVAFMYFLTVQEANGTMQRFWQYGNTGGFEFVKHWDIPKIVEDEVRACVHNLKHGKKTPKKVIDLIAAPQVVGIMMHECVGHPFEADRILGREGAQAGESFVTPDMLGSKVGNPCLTVADDPTLEHSYGFYHYDNEGVKARPKLLIKEGIINEFLHNRQTAARLGIMSNGSSRAVDYDKESIVRMSNTFMMPGNYSEEELIEGVKDGIYMKNFMEWNIDDKRVNQKYVGAEAYFIKNGEITHPVRNPIIEISTLELYKAVDAVAKNMEYHAGNCGKGEPIQAIPVWFGGPSIRLRNVRVK